MKSRFGCKTSTGLLMRCIVMQTRPQLQSSKCCATDTLAIRQEPALAPPYKPTRIYPRVNLMRSLLLLLLRGGAHVLLESTVRDLEASESLDADGKNGADQKDSEKTHEDTCVR